MGTKEALPVKFGMAVLPERMTFDEVIWFGVRTMPAYLKQLGWRVFVFRSDAVIHGSDYFRVSFCR